MEEKEVEQKYASLLADGMFDKLSLTAQEPNIFKILGVENNEIKHSNFLAWLLNPSETHGLNDTFLQRVLQDFFIDDRAKGVSIIELPNLDFSKIEIRREWQNIDILLITETFVISIENKMWSSEHSNQLKRYTKIVEDNFPDRKKIFVFLSPSGNESSENDKYLNYSYISIIGILENLKKSRGHLMSPTILTYVSDYLVLLKQNIMKSDKANEYAVQIYKNHKELFDFVFENKPDMAEEFRTYFEQRVNKEGWVLGSRNKGNVRFFTEKMIDLIPKYKESNGWPDREGFLFEIDFYWSKQRSLTFKSIITPGDEDFRKIMAEQIAKVEGSQKPAGAKWLTQHTLKFPFVLEKLNDAGEYDINFEIDKFWPKIVALVNKVEASVLEKEDELKIIKKRIEN